MSKSVTIIFLLFIAVLITSAAATLFHPSVRSTLKKRHANRTTTHQRKRFVPHFNWEQMEYLNSHNALRHSVGVPPLTWDASLTASAHAWAMKRRRDCRYRYHSRNQYGENIYWMNYKEFTPKDVVHKWFTEYKFYNHGNHACSCTPERAGCECGHYLNVIWYTTQRVGCSGAVYCHNQKGVIVVCAYDPAGLIPGINPFNGAQLYSRNLLV